MSDLIQLTEAEIAGVSGGNPTQTISITATQTNSASVWQSASASNSGAVTATAWGWGALAAAVGAESSNTSFVRQSNSISARNSL
jgi:hypothetical protein